MKGPRKREDSQPATNPNLRQPAEKGDQLVTKKYDCHEISGKVYTSVGNTPK